MKTASNVVVVGVTYFVAVIALLHVLRPDIDPLTNPTSVYAVGELGGLMTTCFFALSIATFALLFALARGVRPSAPPVIGLVLLGVWGVAVLVAAVFPIDVDPAPRTSSGTIHMIAGRTGFTSATIATVLISWSAKNDAKWKARRVVWISSLMLVAAYIAAVALVAAGYGGLGQRIYLVMLVAWYGVTALELRAIAARRTEAPPQRAAPLETPA